MNALKKIVFVGIIALLPCFMLAQVQVLLDDSPLIDGAALTLNQRGILTVLDKSGKALDFRVKLDRYGPEGADVFEKEVGQSFDLIRALATARTKDQLEIWTVGSRATRVFVAEMKVAPEYHQPVMPYSLLQSCPSYLSTCISLMQNSERIDDKGKLAGNSGLLEVGIYDKGARVNAYQVPYQLYLESESGMQQLFNTADFTPKSDVGLDALFIRASVADILPAWKPGKRLRIMPFDPELKYAFPPEGFVLSRE